MRAGALPAGSFPTRPAARTGRLIAGAAATAALFLAVLIVATALSGVGGASLETDASGADGASQELGSALARRDIPTTYLRLYAQAAQRYGLDWAILAGIGEVECDQGRDPDPSCSREGVVNSAGAGGPMQFISSTWTRYGVDGDGDGTADRWDAADAIYSAANYLAASGAPRDYSSAIFSYNHAGWYVQEVESWASRYRGSTAAQTDTGDPLAAQVIDPEGAEGGGGDVALASQTATPVSFISGEQASLSPADGHVALIPVGVPYVVQAMLVAGNELQSLSYGPGGHPDPRGAREEDCSSSVNYLLYRSGVRPISEILSDNPLAQDYVGWGLPGPGRWVTIYATTAPSDHVFIVVAGVRLDTSHDGTDVGPNYDQDGPRWRILDHIPTWAHWSVRHPPGL